ncbi:anthranilate synthase component I [Bacillus timonensis]|nr:anthranilate synthase component I [Bacillus timonensis]
MVQQKRVPLARKISYQKQNWFEQYKLLSKDEPYHVLLESGRGGKYSIMGLNPIARLKGKDNTLTISTKQQSVDVHGNLLQLMKEWMATYQTDAIEGYPEFQGGAIGYISYDLVRSIEKLPTVAKDDLDTPDLYFLIFDDVFVFDHEEECLWLITHFVEGEKQKAEDRLGMFEKMWTTFQSADASYHHNHKLKSESSPLVSVTEEEFIAAAEKVRSYISYGDIFQVNLSVRQSRSIHTHPMDIYSSLRQVNPSPYMAFMQLQEFQLVSGSPELLVKKKGNEVSTRPIAGTRSRGKNDEEDHKLANELIESEKERAEHVMLVDLERNDLGRVCEFGSVEVNEFMVIEKYSHVMHIVSNVKGKLSENKDVYDIINATFPGGTITGAPKVRTMEIIEELEPVRRGIYTGSIGWISFTGDMELNIAIRTMLTKDGYAHVQAGAGVVIDSNPKHEYKESLKKAIALWKAKELSEAELEQKMSMR